MMSFRTEIVLFLFGLIGIGLGVSGWLPDVGSVFSVLFGLGVWFLLIIWKFIRYTIRIPYYLKRSWQISKEYKADKALEEKQVIQRGASEAEKRARIKRLELWVDIFGGS